MGTLAEFVKSNPPKRLCSTCALPKELLDQLNAAQREFEASETGRYREGHITTAAMIRWLASEGHEGVTKGQLGHHFEAKHHRQ